MTLETFYEMVGGDLTSTVGRLGSTAMVERFLRMFAGDDSFDMLAAAMSAGDVQRAFRAAHTLKGVAANMGLERLRAAASELTEALRGGDMGSAKELFPAAETAYRQVYAGVDELETGA